MSHSESTPDSIKVKGAPSTRRSKFEIWSELLEACAWHTRTQSWLMRQLGLKTSAIKEALEFLVSGQLLEQVKDPQVGTYEFCITDKGRIALHQYFELVETLFTSN